MSATERALASAWKIAALASVATTMGCAPPTYAAPRLPSQAEWTLARAHLAELRANEPDRPYVMDLRVALHERLSGRGFDARGALAIDPHHAARLILLGPGGTTAVDLWVSRGRFRLLVPSFDYVRRGGTDKASMSGLPVAFFRAFFLEFLDGTLLTAHFTDSSRELVLQASEVTLDLLEKRPAKGGSVPLTATLRRPGADDARIEWYGRSLKPHAGDVARYVDLPRFGSSSALDVVVRIESVGTAEPDPDAFLDPDAETPRGVSL